MSQILDNIYLAGFEETYTNEEMRSNITHILNVASEIMVTSRANHEYRKIAIHDDDCNSDIRDILPDCLSYIHAVVQHDGVICIHCLEGKSRSVCVCIAYMCCLLGWNIDDALRHIRERRPCITNNSLNSQA
jgi:protein-tyrosine phosphatase